MQVDQAVLDALTALQESADNLLAARTAKSLTATALTSAQTADRDAGSAVASAEGDEATKLDAAVNLLRTRFGQPGADAAEQLLSHYRSRGKQGVTINWGKWIAVLVQVLTSLGQAMPQSAQPTQPVSKR